MARAKASKKNGMGGSCTLWSGGLNILPPLWNLAAKPKQNICLQERQKFVKMSLTKGMDTAPDGAGESRQLFHKTYPFLYYNLVHYISPC